MHRFNDPDWKGEMVPAEVKHDSVKSLFAARVKDAPSWMKEIMGKNPNPKWWSPAPKNILQPLLDYKLAVHCLNMVGGGLADAKNSWMCALIRSTDLIVQPPTLGGRCFFSLGDWCSVAAIGWPAERIETNVGVVLVPSTTVTMNDLQWLVVTDLEGWKSCPTDWASPARLRAQGCSVWGKVGVVSFEGPKESLMRTASREGFWDLAKTQLLWLAKHFALEVRKNRKCSPNPFLLTRMFCREKAW